MQNLYAQGDPENLSLLWKTLHAIIPMKINLISRSIDVDLFCVPCDVEVKTAEHIFEIVSGFAGCGCFVLLL